MRSALGSVGSWESSVFMPERKCAPSMGTILEVEVLLQAGHSEQREVQLREGDRAWGGSMERIRELINKKQI